MTAPIVSVVTPVFDAGRDLAQALASVAAQTFTDREHVLVDDGSTDAETTRLLDAARACPGVTVLRTENRGPAAARNLAIEHARGRYVLPLDADDYLAPDFLAKTVPILDARPDVGVVHTWVALVGGHEGVWKTGPFELPALLARCTVHVICLFRRALWADVGGFDARYVEGAEDWDFWIALAGRGAKALCVPEVLAYYRRTPRSRERAVRATGLAGKLMRQLVEKHRPLYEAHLPDALALVYDELARVSNTLERIYAHPLARLALRLRDVVRRRDEP
ncbi:MAG: glycosyltransferase family 2 protein [Candidatus Binatia bacterium]